MKVVSLRADNSGGAHYRIKEPARAVSAAYPEIKVSIENGLDVTAKQNPQTKMTIVNTIETDADLIVMQRPLAQYFTSAIEAAHRQGIAVVVELDDDFENVNSSNTVWPNLQPHLHPESNWRWVHEACKLADWVTVSTPALKRYAPHGRVSVVPNYIPRQAVSVYPIVARTGPARIGWSGTVQTHPDDLQVTVPAVNQALRDTGSEFVVVGDQVGVRERLQLARSIPLRNPSKWVPTDEYMQALYGSMDVGIVPLELTPFNEAKSALKGLEYAASGIPFIASPTGEYSKLAESGIGEIASSPSQWRRALTQLINNEEQRVKLGRVYRERLIERHILEDHVSEWVDAWDQAISFRKVCTKTA